MWSYVTTVSEVYRIQLWSFIDSKNLYMDILNSPGGNKSEETIEGFKYKEDINHLVDLVNPINTEEFKTYVKHFCKTHKRVLRNRG